MKNLLFMFLFLFMAGLSHAQLNGITSKGDKVILFSDGTWEYEDKKIFEWEKIKHNNKKFKKDAASDFLVESNRTNVGVWMDPTEWKFEKSDEEEETEYSFQMRGEDLFGMMITEKTQIPLETLTNVVLQNAKSVAPNAKFIKQEFRNVNNTEVLLLQMNGTIQGIDFVYYGYYYSDENGTVQLLTYTAENMFEEYLPEIENFLNGFVALK